MPLDHAIVGRSFFDRVFGGDAVPALFYLVTAAKLSPDEVAELRRLLEHKDRENE